MRYISNNPEYEEYFYNKCSPAVLEFTWLPKRCAISGKRIWLKYGYKMTMKTRVEFVWMLGSPEFEERWHDRDSHIFWRLTR